MHPPKWLSIAWSASLVGVVLQVGHPRLARKQVSRWSSILLFFSPAHILAHVVQLAAVGMLC